MDDHFRLKLSTRVCGLNVSQALHVSIRPDLGSQVAFMEVPVGKWRPRNKSL